MIEGLPNGMGAARTDVWLVVSSLSRKIARMKTYGKNDVQAVLRVIIFVGIAEISITGANGLTFGIEKLRREKLFRSGLRIEGENSSAGRIALPEDGAVLAVPIA